MNRKTFYELIAQMLINEIGVITNEALWKQSVIQFADFERHLFRNNDSTFYFIAVNFRNGVKLVVRQRSNWVQYVTSETVLSWSSLYRYYSSLYPNLFEVK